MRAEEYDTKIGLETFTTKSLGIGGRLRQSPEDFIVQEIGLDGSIAPLTPTEQTYTDQPGKFLAFFLVKRNLDTIQAIRVLSKTVGVSYKRFSYAGMKDRRAITSQRVSFYRGTRQDLIGREIPKIQLLHPHRVAKPTVPGALQGNRFTITVREVNLPKKEVQHRLTSIRNDHKAVGGFLNYYGPQRFGIMQPTTHLVGRELIRGNFEEAVKILLQGEAPTYNEEEDLAEETDDARSQHSRFGAPYQTYERAITHYLNKHPEDFTGCLKVIPKDLARLYIHAYQSFIFNRVISKRASLGISLQQPQVGDYIMPISGEIHAVRSITKENLTTAETAVKTGTQKLVIPIIGYDFETVEFAGVPGDIITSVLEEENVAPEFFRIKDFPVLSSRGTFRPLLVDAKNLEAQVFEEKDDTPVTIRFDLAKGSYASVILREIIKPDYPTQL
ncbi:MAG: tRNA pseudouridine(13) synthase TruD [Candidatus Thorarchaeota archaeon]